MIGADEADGALRDDQLIDLGPDDPALADLDVFGPRVLDATLRSR